MWTRGLLAVLAMAAGCGLPDKGVRIAGTTQASLAVGSRYRFAVIDACEYAGPGFIILGPAVPLIIPTPPSCLSTSVSSIRSITWSDPSVMRVTQQAVDQGAALFEVAAVAEGETSFTVTIATSEGIEYTASGRFTARRAERVAFDGVCPSAATSTDTIVPVDRGVRFRPALFDRNGAQLAGFGFLPIEVDGAAISLESDGTYGFMPRAQPTQVVVTSSIDPGFRKVIEVLDASAVDQLVLSTSLPAIETTIADQPLISAAMVDGRHSCFDSFPRRVVVETPTVCGVHEQIGQPPPTTTVSELPMTDGVFVSVRGLQRGQTCRVRMEVLGSTVVSTISLPVREGWTEMTPPAEISLSRGISLGPDRVLVVGTRNAGTGSMPLLTAAVVEWDGATWSTATPSIPANVTNQGRLDGVTAVGATVFAVGAQGAIVTRNGSGPWLPMPSGVTSNLLAVHAWSATEALAVGEAGAVTRLSGGAWQPMLDAAPATTIVHATWGSSANDLWIAGDDLLRHWDGTAWSSPDVSALVTPPFRYLALWGTAPDDVYVGGISAAGGAVLHWDGAAWTRPLAEFTYGLWGSGPDDIYATGKVGFGEIEHWDGTRWTARNIARNFTRNVWGAGPAELYVLAHGNDLYRYR